MTETEVNTEKKTGYKKTKLGWIPEEWSVKKFGKTAKIIMGQSPNGNTYNENKNGVPLINGPTEFTERYPVKKQWTTEPTKLCKKNDILICVRGSSTGRINISDGEYCIGRGVAALRSTEINNQDYLEYQLDHQLPQLLKLTSGSTFPNINSKNIKNLRIPVPPLTEQKKIAKTISTWDEAISKTEKLIHAKKRYKKGLMQRLFSGRVRFAEFEGEDWVEVKLGEVFTERNEKGFNDLKLVAITTNDGVIDRDELDRRDTSNDDKSNYKHILPGDIGYNTMRMWQGVSGYSELEGIASPAYTIVTPVKGKVDGVFMSYLFKHPPVIDLFRRYSQGLVSDTLNLKYTNFAQIKLNIPPSVEEQKMIATVFAEIDKEIYLMQKEATLYQKQKKGLMQQLLTGKLRVN